MAFVVAEPCIGTKDRACVEVCPVECFYEGEDQLYIHPEECIDCAACEPVCPVTAIFPADSVPDPWKPYIQKNIDFFTANPDVPKALTKAMRGDQDNFARVFTVEGKTIKLPPPPPGYPAPIAKAKAASAEAKAEAKMEVLNAEAPQIEVPKAEPKVETPKAEAPKPEPKGEAPKPAPTAQPAAIAVPPDLLAQVAEVAAKALEAAAAAAKAAEATVAALKALQGKVEGRAGTGAPSAQAAPPQVKAAEPKKVEAAAPAEAPVNPKEAAALKPATPPHPTAKPEPVKPAIDLKGYEKGREVILDLVEMLSGIRELDLTFVAEAEKFAGELKAQVAKEFGKEIFTASELEKKDPILRQKYDLANAILERVQVVDLLAQYHRKRRPISEYAVGGLLTGAVALACQLFAFWTALKSASITVPNPTIWDYLRAALTPEGLVPFLGFSTLAGLMGLFPLYAAYKIFSAFRELKALREGPLREARIDPKSRLHIAPYRAI